MTERPLIGVIGLVVTTGEAPQLVEVLRGVAEQTLPVTELILVRAGTSRAAVPLDLPIPVTTVDAPEAENLGEAVRAALATEVVGRMTAGARWLWLLHDDSVPDPDCLEELWDAADKGRTIAVVGPKQMDPSGEILLEVGIRATHTARRLDALLPGEIDQGQYDAISDVLAVGSAGMLVDHGTWQDLGGMDPHLGPFGDGLEFCRRVRLSGRRVVLAPRARIRHARRTLEPLRSSYRQRRTAQLHNWALAVPTPIMPLLMAWLVVWTPMRALARLVMRSPFLARAEIAAWLVLVARTPSLFTRKATLARQRVIPASALRVLESTPAELMRQRRLALRAAREAGRTLPDPLVTDSLARHRATTWTHGLVTVAIAGLVSALLWWNNADGLVGGAWRILPPAWGDLWQQATSWWIAGGDGHLGAPDPLLLPLALLSAPAALLGVTPTGVATAILVTSVPLAAASAWWYSGVLTRNATGRAALVLAWAFLPAARIGAAQGRLADVFIHVALPLLALAWWRATHRAPALTVNAAHEAKDVPLPSRWGWSGLAALSAVLVAAAAPWLLLIALVLLVLTLPWMRHRFLRALLVLLPSLALLAPTVAFVVREALDAGRAGETKRLALALASLTSTSGGQTPVEVPQAWQVVLGLPTEATWNVSVAVGTVWGALLLLLALLGSLVTVIALHGGRRAQGTDRRPGLAVVLTCTVVAALHLLLAVVLTRVPVAVAGGGTTSVVTAWPAPAQLVAALALLTVVALTLPRLVAVDLGAPWDSPLLRRATVAWAVLGLAVIGVGGVNVADSILARLHPDADPALVHASEVPAVPAITSQGQESERAGRVLVLSGGDGWLDARVWRRAGAALTDDNALLRARELALLLVTDHGAEDGSPMSGADTAADELRHAAFALTVYPDEAAVDTLLAHDIDTVLLPDTSTDWGMLTAQALNRAPGLEKVGPTDAGLLWRVRPAGLQASRLLLRTTGDEAPLALPSGALDAEADLPADASGTLVLAERADTGWGARLDGVLLEPTEGEGWAQEFTLTSGGHLTLSHETTGERAWRSVTLVLFALAALMALPLRRAR